jgi:Tfp pilus assembly protein PilV
MPDTPPSNAKIYDRPERKGPPPVVIAMLVVILCILGYLAYRAMHRPAAPAAQTQQTGAIRVVPELPWARAA